MDDLDEYDDGFYGGEFLSIPEELEAFRYTATKGPADKGSYVSGPGTTAAPTHKVKSDVSRVYKRRDYELALMVELIARTPQLTGAQSRAFRSMLMRLATGQEVLTPKQFDWAQNVAVQLGVPTDRLPKPPEMLRASALSKLTDQEAASLGLLKGAGCS